MHKNTAIVIYIYIYSPKYPAIFATQS